MLVQNKPEEGLQPHQLAAYRAARRGFKEKRKASVIMPTGCGKSFVALQMMLDYKDDNILITVPTIVIKNQYYEYIAKYIVGEEPTTERTARMIAEEYFPNLKITTYTAIQRADSEIIKKLNPKLAITDEAHRSIAEQTSKNMEVLFDSFPDAYWLGITATPERMDGKNVVDHFYEGTIDYELTLEEALRRRIVKEPHYVPCAYALSDKLEDVKKAIDECTNPQKRAKLEEIYEKMRNIVAQAEGIPELITNNIQVKDGKVIVFCKDKAHMDELMSKVQEWFGQIDSNPEIYSLYSGTGYTTQENIETIKAFKASKSNHLKILFTIDMLNEGIHMDVDTIIMARPTESRLVYNQQLGRGLSSDLDAKPTTIIDLVNNYLNFDLDRTINRVGGTSRTGKGGDDGVDGGDIIDIDYIPIDCFKVTGVMKEFLDLFEETRNVIGNNGYVHLIEEVYEWVTRNNRFPELNEAGTEEERDMHIKFYKVKHNYTDKYIRLKSEEERKTFRIKNPDIDYVLGLVEKIKEFDISAQLKNAQSILDWMKARKYPMKPRLASSDPVEVILARALTNMRVFLKPYMYCKNEEEREQLEKKYPYISTVMSLCDEIERIHVPPIVQTALKIREWVESQPIPRKPLPSNPNERKLNKQINTIRTYYITKYQGCETEEERQDLLKRYPYIPTLIEIMTDVDNMCPPIGLINLRRVKQWMIDHKAKTYPNSRSKDEEERQLGESYRSALRKWIKVYEAITDDKERKIYEDNHPEIFEILELMDWIGEHSASERLRNTRLIRDWIEMPEHGIFPKRQRNNKGGMKPGFEESTDMQEEHALSVKLNTIRVDTCGPFLRLSSPEERDAYLKEHKDVLEVVAILNDLDLRFGSKKQRELAELIHQDRDLHERLEAALALEKEYQVRAKKENEQKKSEQGVDIDGE